MANQRMRQAADEELGRRHPYATKYGRRIWVTAAVAGVLLLFWRLASSAASAFHGWTIPRPSGALILAVLAGLALAVASVRLVSWLRSPLRMPILWWRW